MEILDTASSLESTISFTPAEVAVVKTALKTKLFARAESVEVRTEKFKALVDQLAEAFGVPQLGLQVLAHEEMAFVKFDADANTIVINRRFSLTNTLCGFAMAMIHHKPELMPRPTSMAELFEMQSAGHFNPMSFALSMFKQAAPRMFESAKMGGRLTGTSVPYTDGGRITAERASEDLDDDNGDNQEQMPPTPEPRQQQPQQRPPSAQRPDIDPELRRDYRTGSDAANGFED